MSAESLFQKMQTSRLTGTADDEQQAPVIEDYGSYSVVRGLRDRVPMFELRKKDNSSRAIPYALVESIDYLPAIGLILHVAGHEITIAGQHLNEAIDGRIGLLGALISHRLLWVQESSRARSGHHSGNSTPTPVVESIRW